MLHYANLDLGLFRLYSLGREAMNIVERMLSEGRLL